MVFLFDTRAADATPKCVGALIGKKVAVTARACAKEGMALGRAADKNGKGAQAKVTAVHVPDDKDADIAVVQLDRDDAAADDDNRSFSGACVMTAGLPPICATA